MIKKLKAFLYVMRGSLFNPLYYQDVVSTSFWFSVKYLYMFLVVVLFFSTLPFVLRTFTQLPALKPRLNELKTKVLDAYPRELQLKVVNGIVSTNVKQPYYIDIDSEKDQFGHFIAIDTKAKIDDYRKYNSTILLTKQAVIYPDRQRGALRTYRVSYLDEIKGPITINKKIYDETLNKLLPWVDKAPLIIGVLSLCALVIWPLVGAWFMLLSYMVYMLLFGAILWTVAYFMKKKLSYATVYRLGLHGVSLPIVVTSLLSLFNIHIKFSFSVIFLLWMVVVFNSKKTWLR